MKRLHWILSFTLIELLAVIGIIIVIIAMALPNFGAMVRGQRWAAASAALQNALFRCQTFAMNDRYEHSIEFCTETDNTTQYFRIEAESALLENLPNLDNYYQIQCDCWSSRMPVDWIGAFCAGGGQIQNEAPNYWTRMPQTRYYYDQTKPHMNINNGNWRFTQTIKDNYAVDAKIPLPNSIQVDFVNSKHLINYDPPPKSVADIPQYAWDYTKDLRFNINGYLVQAQNPEIVFMNKDGSEHMRFQVLRTTAKLRKLSGIQ